MGISTTSNRMNKRLDNSFETIMINHIDSPQKSSLLVTPVSSNVFTSMALLKCRITRGYEAYMSNTDCLLLWIRSNVIDVEPSHDTRDFMHPYDPVPKAITWTYTDNDDPIYPCLRVYSTKSHHDDIRIESVDMGIKVIVTISPSGNLLIVETPNH